MLTGSTNTGKFQTGRYFFTQLCTSTLQIHWHQQPSLLFVCGRQWRTISYLLHTGKISQFCSELWRLQRCRPSRRRNWRTEVPSSTLAASAFRSRGERFRCWDGWGWDACCRPTRSLDQNCNWSLSFLYESLQGDLSVQRLYFGDFDLGVPPCCQHGMPILPDLQLPKQNKADIGSVQHQSQQKVIADLMVTLYLKLQYCLYTVMR